MHASAIAYQFSVGSDYPMAWNNDGNGIAVVGHAYCPGSLGAAHGNGNILIGTGFPIRNTLKGLPYL